MVNKSFEVTGTLAEGLKSRVQAINPNEEKIKTSFSQLNSSAKESRSFLLYSLHISHLSG